MSTLTLLIGLASAADGHEFSFGEQGYFKISYTPGDTDLALGASFDKGNLSAGVTVTVSDAGSADDFQIGLNGLPDSNAVSAELSYLLDFTQASGPSTSLAISLVPSLGYQTYSYYEDLNATDETTTAALDWAADLKLHLLHLRQNQGGFAIPLNIAVASSSEAADTVLVATSETSDDGTVQVLEERVVGAPSSSMNLQPSLGLLAFGAKHPFGLGVAVEADLPLADIGGSHSEQAQLWGFVYPTVKDKQNLRLGVGVLANFAAGDTFGADSLQLGLQLRAGQARDEF